jgi:hypothetical protein
MKYQSQLVKAITSKTTFDEQGICSTMLIHLGLCFSLKICISLSKSCILLFGKLLRVLVMIYSFCLDRDNQ